MKNFKLLTAAIFGLICLSAIPTFAQTVTNGVVQGSYTKSCNFAKTIDNVTITAKCREENTSFLNIGSDVYKDATLTNFFTCEGDIQNKDGQLCCTRSLDSDRFRAAIKAFDTVAATLTDGLPIWDRNDWDKEIQGWLRLYYINGYGANYSKNITANTPGVRQTVADFVKNSEQPLKTQFVNNAFLKIYQREAFQPEIDDWSNKIANGKTFSQMVKELTEKKAAEDKEKLEKGQIKNQP